MRVGCRTSPGALNSLDADRSFKAETAIAQVGFLTIPRA
jgi:hypothetical protein